MGDAFRDVESVTIPVVKRMDSVRIEEYLGELKIRSDVAGSLAACMANGLEYRLGATLMKTGGTISIVTLSIHGVPVSPAAPGVDCQRD